MAHARRAVRGTRTAYTNSRRSLRPRQATTGSSSGSKTPREISVKQMQSIAAPIRFDPEPPDLAFLAPGPSRPAEGRCTSIGPTLRHGRGRDRDARKRARPRGTACRPNSMARSWSRTSTMSDSDEAPTSFEPAVKTTPEMRLRRASEPTDPPPCCACQLASTHGCVVGVPRKRRGDNGRRRLDHDVTARYGSVLRLAGLLSNSEGQPLEAATIEALEERPDGTSLPNGLATTRADGSFGYVLRATRNRELLFRYPGSRRIGAATAVFDLEVPAATSIRVSRRTVRNGRAVLFTGRVRSRPLPLNGKLIEMQAHFRGRWRTFSTLRTDRRGVGNSATASALPSAA